MSLASLLWAAGVLAQDAARTAAATAVSTETPTPVATAQASPVMEMVISASRIPEEPGKVGSSITVLTEEDIRRSGALNVRDLLETVPGLQIVSSGPDGLLSEIYLRGASPTQVGVYVDGVRVNSAAFGNYDLADLTLDNLGRVEIVRGPQSALFGADGMGGSVNLYTRQGGGPDRLRIQAEGGSRETWTGRAQASASRAGWDGSLGFSSTSSQSWSAVSESRGATERDPYGKWAGSVRLGGSFLGRLDVIGRFTKSRTGLDGYDNFYNLADQPGHEQHRNQTQLALVHESHPFKALRQVIRVGGGEEIYDETDNFEWSVRNVEAALQEELNHGSWAEAWGFEIVQESDRLTSGRIFTTPSAFGEIRADLPFGGRLTAGLRGDQRRRGQEREPAVLTERATLRQPLGRGGLSLRGSYGSAFRYPNFGEILPPYGSPGLKPEFSRGGDAGLLWQDEKGNSKLSLGLFRSDYVDLIQYDFVAGFQNVARARIQGLEASWEGFSGDFRRQLSYTFTDPRDSSTGDRLARRPAHKITGALSFEKGRLTARAQITGVYDRVASSFDLNKPDDYLLAGLSASFRIWEGLRLGFRAENLGDKVYEDVPGYTSPRRTAFLTASYDWTGR